MACAWRPYIPPPPCSLRRRPRHGRHHGSYMPPHPHPLPAWSRRRPHPGRHHAHRHQPPRQLHLQQPRGIRCSGRRRRRRHRGAHGQPLVGWPALARVAGVGEAYGGQHRGRTQRQEKQCWEPVAHRWVLGWAGRRCGLAYRPRMLGRWRPAAGLLPGSTTKRNALYLIHPASAAPRMRKARMPDQCRPLGLAVLCSGCVPVHGTPSRRPAVPHLWCPVACCSQALCVPNP